MLFLTSQLPFSAKIFSRPLPPPKKSSQLQREYLRADEVNAMIGAAKKVGRHGVRDSAIILLMFRHGLRTAELVARSMVADRFSRRLHRSPKSSRRVMIAFIPYVLPNSEPYVKFSRVIPIPNTFSFLNGKRLSQLAQFATS